MRPKSDWVVVYVPAGMPGATMLARTRYVIALGFAEMRGGMDAEPDGSDHARARAFDVVSWTEQPADVVMCPRFAPGPEMRVIVTGPPGAVRAYRAVLRAIA